MAMAAQGKTRSGGKGARVLANAGQNAVAAKEKHANERGLGAISEPRKCKRVKLMLLAWLAAKSESSRIQRQVNGARKSNRGGMLSRWLLVGG